MHRLTKLSVDRIRPDPDKRLDPDGARPGLYLFVQPSGYKSYVVKYRYGGKQRKLVLQFPTLPSLVRGPRLHSIYSRTARTLPPSCAPLISIYSKR